MSQSLERYTWKGHAHYEVSVECGIEDCMTTEFFTPNQGVRRHMNRIGWRFVGAAHADRRAVGWVCPNHVEKEG